MMQIAGVVQDIFRALGIEGWETAGMEPADFAIAARSDDAGVERPESPEPRGIDRDLAGWAATAPDPAESIGEPETGTALAARFAEERAG